MDRRALPPVRTLVVKVGSATLGDVTGGLHLPTLYALAAQIAEVRRRGVRVLLVSSGAILAGRAVLKLKNRPTELPEKQACAAVGQIDLMARWREAFHVYGIVAAQVLLTAEDLAHRERFLNARNTLVHLLEHGCVPVINENDTVATAEIRVGDNDQLASLTLNLVEADLLVLLSDVEGLFTANPRVDPEARLVPLVEGIDALPEIAGTDGAVGPGGTASGGTGTGAVGTGGMGTKIEAARRALMAGTPAIITAGRTRDVLTRLLDGEPLGTLFRPTGRSLSRRQQWLAFANRPQGRIRIDAGAVQALTARKTSLLPSGITAVTGVFDRGDLVVIEDEEGREVARGLSNYDHRDLERIRGRRSSEIEAVLGRRDFEEAVHRDNMVRRG